MNVAMFVYQCNECLTKFGVDEEFEDQSIVKCPVCGHDETSDVGSLTGIVQEGEN